MDAKKAKFRNISRKGKTFDGFEEDAAGLFSVENIEQFAKDTGRSISDAYNFLKKKIGLNEGGMPRKRTGSIDYRKGGMVMRTTDNRKNKI
jgi:cytochrome oxidase assembly protein ShyY1